MFGKLTQPILVVLGLVVLLSSIMIGASWWVIAVNIAFIIAVIVEPKMPWGRPYHRS